MRKDLGKCVIERPRRGSRAPNVKIRCFGRLVRIDGEIEYEGLMQIPCSFRGAWIAYGDHKDFTDVLGPLKGYLRSSCGRLWDDVYSEIAVNLKRGPWPIQHIVKDHLDVAVNTYRGVDGEVWSNARYGGPRQVTSWRYPYHEFYVEPETGILRETVYRRRRPVKPPVTEIPISEGKEYTKKKGIWYYREFEMTSVKTRIVGYGGRVRFEADPVLVWERKKQLNKKELRDLKLKNG